MYVSANSGSAGGFKSGAGAAADEEIHAGIVLSDVENARMNPKSPTHPASSSTTSVFVVPPTGDYFQQQYRADNESATACGRNTQYGAGLEFSNV
jgi:hypothetical protein